MSEQEQKPNTTFKTPFSQGGLRLNLGMEPVDWKEAKEKFDPSGDRIPAKDLIDRTFIISEIKPFESSFGDGGTAFYIKATLPDTGELFNTILGGSVTGEVLASFMDLNAQLQEALELGDNDQIAYLTGLGAGAPIKVTLREMSGGKFGRYYAFD